MTRSVRDFCFNRYWALVAIAQGLHTLVRGAKAPDWLLFITMKRSCRQAGIPMPESKARPDTNSILSVLDQRIYGLVIILQGLMTLVVGNHAPNLQLGWIMNKALKRSQTQVV